MNVTLTIKNYRCFVRPTVIDVSRDFTAFVGVNNAGKSALMRFLLEFRHLFSSALDRNAIRNGLTQEVSFTIENVLDREEIFSNRNTRDIEFRLSFTYGAEERDASLVSQIDFKVSRNSAWTAVARNVGGHAVGGQPVIFNGDQFNNASGGPIVNLRPFIEVAARLSNTLYVGPFRNAINVGGNDNYIDIKVGQAFITQFRNLKNGSSKRDNTAILNLIEDIRRIFEFKTLDIDATPDGQTLHIAVNGKPYKQHELGSGLAQFVLVLANASTRRPSYILIDEPELNLHPRLQLDFLTTLASYASEGVWFSTHSIGLARSTTEKIYSVRRVDDGDSQVTPLGGVPRLAEFLGEMSFSSHKELGFAKILLVEGATEVKTVQQILRKMSKDHEIVLLSLGGRINGNMAEELEEIKRITPDISALIDSEKSHVDEPLSPARQAFVTLCAALNIPCHVLERRATEQYFGDDIVKTVFGVKFRGLGPFEKFESVTPRWDKGENWRLALATPFEQIVATDIGVFLQTL